MRHRWPSEPLRHDVQLHVHMHDTDVVEKLDLVLQLLSLILRQGDHLMAAYDDILAKVEAQPALIASVKTLIAELRANAGDPAKLQSILAGLDRNAEALADALVTPGPVVEPGPGGEEPAVVPPVAEPPVAG
jgi:hypothetical protein